MYCTRVYSVHKITLKLELLPACKYEHNCSMHNKSVWRPTVYKIRKYAIKNINTVHSSSPLLEV